MSIRSLLESFDSRPTDSCRVVADALDVKLSRVWQWRHRGTISTDYIPAFVALCREHGITITTDEICELRKDRLRSAA